MADALTPAEREAAVEVFGEEVVKMSEEKPERDPLRTCPTCEGRGGGCVDCDGTGCERAEVQNGCTEDPMEDALLGDLRSFQEGI